MKKNMVLLYTNPTLSHQKIISFFMKYFQGPESTNHVCKKMDRHLQNETWKIF